MTRLRVPWRGQIIDASVDEETGRWATGSARTSAMLRRIVAMQIARDGAGGPSDPDPLNLHATALVRALPGARIVSGRRPPQSVAGVVY